MEKYESGEYTETVLESVRILRDQSRLDYFHLKRKPVLHLVVPNFVEKIKLIINILQMKSPQDDQKVTKNQFDFILKSNF